MTTTRGLFSPQTDRWWLMDGAEQIARALRNDDLDMVAQRLDSHAAGLGVHDAVLGRESLFQVPWRTDFTGPPRHDVMVIEGSWGTKYTDHLNEELWKRGATVQYAEAHQLGFDAAGTLYLDGRERSVPQAIYPGSDMHLHTGLLDALQAHGSFVVNDGRALVAGYDKNEMGVGWQRAGIPTPETRTHLRTIADVMRAGAELGFPAVLKEPRSAMSLGVEEVGDPDELMDLAEEWGIPTNGGARQSGLLLQRMANFGGRDLRVHFARDAVTGELRIVGATERASLGGDFRANEGDEGNMIRPIYDLSGGDLFLTRHVITTVLRAAEALGLDSGGADVGVDRSDGQALMIEIDTHPHPHEMNVPVPREQQMFPRIADLLVWAQPGSGRHRAGG